MPSHGLDPKNVISACRVGPTWQPGENMGNNASKQTDGIVNEHVPKRCYDYETHTFCVRFIRILGGCAGKTGTRENT